ncbi:MAG: hypothetical protein Aurels2KO_56790 [Aureliella sp.]
MKWQCLIALLQVDAAFMKKRDGVIPTKREFVDDYPELVETILDIPIECIVDTKLPVLINGYTTIDLVHVTESFLIYVVRNLKNSKYYFAKICRRPELKSALESESRLLAGLKTGELPVIVATTTTTDGSFCLILDVMHGKTLHSARLESNCSAIILDVALQILDSLHAIHRKGFRIVTPLRDNVIVDKGQAKLLRLDETRSLSCDSIKAGESSFLFELGHFIAWFVFSGVSSTTRGQRKGRDRLEQFCRLAVAEIREPNGPFSSPEQFKAEITHLRNIYLRKTDGRFSRVFKRILLFVAVLAAGLILTHQDTLTTTFEDSAFTTTKFLFPPGNSATAIATGELLATPLREADFSIDIEIRRLPPNVAFELGYGFDCEYRSALVVGIIRDLPISVEILFSTDGAEWRNMRKESGESFSTILDIEELRSEARVRVTTTNGISNALLCEFTPQEDLDKLHLLRDSQIRGELTQNAKSNAASSKPFIYKFPSGGIATASGIEIPWRPGWRWSSWLIRNRTAIQSIGLGERPDALKETVEFILPLEGRVEALNRSTTLFPKPLAVSSVTILEQMTDLHHLHYAIRWIDGTISQGSVHSGVPPRLQGLDLRPGMGGGQIP